MKAITDKQRILLSFLIKNEKASQEEMAEHMKCSRQNVKQILFAMSAKGFVEINPNKRRDYIITEKGKEGLNERSKQC